MGIYDTIYSAKTSKSGSYYEEGHYTVRVDAVKEVPSSQKPGKVFFVIETTCLASDNPKIKVGQEYSQVIDLQNIMAMPNIKGFLGAASGLQDVNGSDNDELNDAIDAYWSAVLERKVTLPQICELVTSSSNPLEGLELGLHCQQIRTKAGTPFTKYNWSTLEPE